jgi:predicted metal-binding protein
VSVDHALVDKDIQPPVRAAVSLFVCVTCGRSEGEALSRGARLHAAATGAVADGGDDGWLAVRPVECLSVCKRPTTVAIAAAGKWTYVYGDIDPVEDLPDLIEAARRYAGAADGIVPWRERPARIRTRVVARIPPLPATDGTRP